MSLCALATAPVVTPGFFGIMKYSFMSEMFNKVSLLAYELTLVPRNSSRGRGVVPSLAELGEQSYQLTSAWVLPVWNVAS
jgi:hypothetical protein